MDSEAYALDFNGMESTVVLYYDNDKFFAQTLLTEAPYSSFNLSTKEETEEIMTSISKQC